MSATDQSPQRRERRNEGRPPDYVVRAKCGPGHRDWTQVGYAWNRDGGEGISVKLNSMPIGEHWNGVLKVLPANSDAEGSTDHDA